MKLRKRYCSHERRGQLPTRVSIKERPVIVANLERVGDWGLDTIIGKGIVKLKLLIRSGNRV